MHKLLIVDDEPFIADGLFRFIQKILYENLDVYRAYSAEEAMDWLNKTKIDIVISDIQMPGINGLQLIKEIHEKWPMCKVIFLTGYNEFEYAYTAIEYNVASYVLKSEGDEAIIKALDKCIAEIENKIKNEELVKKVFEQAQMSLPFLQKEYLMNILQGEKTSCQSMQQYFTQLQIHLSAKLPVLLLGGRIDNYSPDLTYSEKASYLSGIDVVFQEYLGASTISVNIMWDRRYLIWMIQPRSMNLTDNTVDIWAKSITFIKGTLESVQETCKQSLGISLSLILDNKPSDWNEVEERYFSMKQIVNYKIGTGIEMALTDKDFYNSELRQLSENDNLNQKMQAYLEKLELLKNFLECGKKEEFYSLLNDEIEYLCNYGQINYCFGLEMYQSISLVFLSYMNKLNLRDLIESEGGLGKFATPKEFIKKDIFEYFFRLGEYIFQFQNRQQTQKFDNLITNLHKYIHEHLGKDLSLVTLSETVYLNPAYLSRLYKQVTGKNISEYISELRLNKAKALLRKNDMKINEIAGSIGYESAAHFSRLFKRATNMTPQEYREQV